MSTDKLNIYEFGSQLLETNDLDPVYVLLHHANFDAVDLRRWLLAYWCFYHVGTASWVLEGRAAGDYWSRMEQAAGSKDWPRSSERRHFRGDNAKKSVAYLKNRGSAALFDDLEQAGNDARKVIWAVQQWVGFGPWIAFKVADMLERLGIQHVDFDLSTVMYSSPQEAAEELWRIEHPGEGRRSANKDEGEWAINRILSELGERSAPPGHDRAIGAQEAETILCKFKSYINGHYHVGEDIAAVRAGLLRFARSKTAQRLFRAGREGGLWA